ncbi:MAG: aminotransferase class IV, partial [Phycisphaerales bacterium]
MQVWLNGRLVNAQDAKISVFDRGFLFGDGVYEVVRFFGGGPVGMDLHIARLARSLALTRIEGFDAAQLQSISTALIEKNGWPNASIY